MIKSDCSVCVLLRGDCGQYRLKLLGVAILCASDNRVYSRQGGEANSDQRTTVSGVPAVCQCVKKKTSTNYRNEAQALQHPKQCVFEQIKNATKPEELELKPLSTLLVWCQSNRKQPTYAWASPKLPKVNGRKFCRNILAFNIRQIRNQSHWHRTSAACQGSGRSGSQKVNPKHPHILTWTQRHDTLL